MSSSIAFALLALIAALTFIDYSDACAPTTTKTNTTAGRRKRSIEEDVHVVVVSNEKFDLSTNEKNMKIVEEKLMEFADKEGISFRALQNMGTTEENVGGKLGVYFDVGESFDRCARIFQFIQAAVNSLDELVSGTVQCGAYDEVHVAKKTR